MNIYSIFPFLNLGSGGGGNFSLEFQGDRVQHDKAGGDSWRKYGAQSRKLENHISSIDSKQRDQTGSGARL